jgi:hypothetical protein
MMRAGVRCARCQGWNKFQRLPCFGVVRPRRTLLCADQVLLHVMVTVIGTA